MSEQSSLKIPTTVIARKGIAYLTSQAQKRPVTLTNHGLPVAVVMSHAEHDEQRRTLKNAELRILEIAASLATGLSPIATSAETR
ncbi:prevent-host-death family protein [Leucobacter exalbidus]|uniref:Prevent-host-death family protein n=1 Tax=Leucobacter exalbidus TaxID=662960 RepID=A0A940PSM9_9MICO|nr:type II toxin-antitoxin system prevent-host-death family antitoxin [Leucobacter exalbidus]MBP1326053.1 prevent-host-death family protein [Leucobacter exalbidus]